MSVFSASTLSASDTSFTRQVKPLPKRRRTSFPSSEGDGHGLTSDTLFTSSSYHHPIESGGVDRPKGNFGITPPRPRLSNKPLSTSPRPRIPDDADGEGDYADHLQQPNNTKKRKVPTATAFSGIHDTGPGKDQDDSVDENAPALQVNLSGKTSSGLPREFDFRPTVVYRKPSSPITLATLRLKELMKSRRKMMAAALREEVNLLALEFALSAPFPRLPTKHHPRAWSYNPKSRRRPRSRVDPIPPREPCFSAQFTFSFPSSASKRYTAAKKAAAGLQLRFQTELARQATDAAEIAIRTASNLPSDPTGQERRRADPGPILPHSSGLSTHKKSKKSNKPKKKKRSALANASNPHHLRNYVPSRVSQGHSASSTHGQSQPTNSLGPLALKFLSASLSSRRKGRTSAGDNMMGPNLIRPENEWICPFCEYSLFYGSDDALHRAVKNRRRVLARRRNARERAAAAASGVIGPQSQDVSEDEADTDEDEDGESFDDGSEIAPSTGRQRGDMATPSLSQNARGPHPGG